MPLYSASKLIGSTLVMNGLTNYYRVFDINTLGDKAKPAGVLKNGQSIQVDSFLLPSDSYTSSYGIKYAKRSDTYLTYYVNGQNYAVKLNDIGKQSDNLKEQGIQSVKDEVEQAKKDGSLFGDFGKVVKTVLILLIIILILYYLLPVIVNKYGTKGK